MKKYIIIIVIVLILLIIALFFNNYLIKEEKIETKEKRTTGVTTTTKMKGETDLMDGITLNYHASIRLEKNGKIIYFDPYKIDKKVNDANYIFITHSHYDHYSEDDIKKVMNDDTKFIVTSDLEKKIINLGVKESNLTIAYPNKNYTFNDLKFDAVTAYNINSTYHKKSFNWVGYNVDIDGVKYYVVGDSDATEELKNTKCDVIFVPVGGTYTMTHLQAADAVNSIKPKVAVPIHYGEVGSRKNAEEFINNLNEDIKGVILK